MGYFPNVHSIVTISIVLQRSLPTLVWYMFFRPLFLQSLPLPGLCLAQLEATFVSCVGCAMKLRNASLSIILEFCSNPIGDSMRHLQGTILPALVGWFSFRCRWRARFHLGLS